MKQKFTYYLLLVLLFAISINKSMAQTIAWNFTDGTVNPSITTTGVTTSALVQGNNNGTTPFITTTSASSGYTGASGTYNAAIASRTGALNTAEGGSAYFEFTLTPETGKTVTLSAIKFGMRSTSTGPQAYTLRASTDNYSTDKATGTFLANSTWVLLSNTVSVTSAAGTPITFRLYGYNGSGTAAANTANWRIDDLSLSVAIAAASNNANLSGLSISAGTLTPDFSATTNAYSATVANSVSTITVTPTATDAGASIKVNGTTVSSGNASSAITLNTGSNTINTTVTAADGTTTNNYTITVTRASAGAPALRASTLPSFNDVCTNNTATVSFTLNGSDLDGSSISLSALEGFQYATTATGPFTSTLSFAAGSSFSNKVIYVQFTPTAVQSYAGAITINGGGVSNYAVAVSGAGINTPPSAATGIAAVSAISATLSGTISSNGCTALTGYGIEYSTTNGFTNGAGTQVLANNISGGSFTTAFSALIPNTTYYYKAFGTNSGGTAYGAQASFTTTAVPVAMALQEDLNYKETFDAIATWSNGFTAGTGANHFSAAPVGATGTIPGATKISTATTTFVSGSSGGVQKGSGAIILLSTGATDNTTSGAIDLWLDFTGVNAGTLSFDWASVNNGMGDRNGSLRVYATVNGTAFTELAAADVLNFTNNVLTNGTVNVQLPATFNNNPNARLRFYYHNGSGGTTGSRPKISINNLSVTAISTTPCVTPSVQPTALTFGTVTETSIQGSFTPASPAPNKYLVIMSQNSSLTSNPVDGQVYEAGDNVGDGDVVAYSSSTTFTATGLSGATHYNFFIFSVNNACTDGPKYLVADPLQNDVTTVAGLPACAAPADQPTNLSLTATTNAVQGSFTAALGNEYIVLQSKEATLTALPQNGQVYNAGSVIGNSVVVQRNSILNFTAPSLLPETKYYYFIFSLNAQACTGGPVYNTMVPLSGTVTTLPLSPCAPPAAQPTNLILHATNNAVSGTFNAAATADDYLVIQSTSNALTAQPADNTDYLAGDNFGGGKVVSNNPSTSFVAGNLNAASTYYFFVFAANKNCTGGTKYLSIAPLAASVTTTATPAYHVYFGNLHAHSDYSDGNKDHPGYTPADDYKYAMTADCMDFLGISEHNHFSSPDNPGNLITNYHKGSVQADSFTKVHPNFLALYGMEWGVISGGGHVVVYGDGMDKLFGWESNVGGLTGPNYDVYVAKSDYTGPNGLFKNVNDFAANNTFAMLAHPNSTDFNNLSNVPYNSMADDAIVGTAVESGPATSTNTSYTNPGSPMYYLWYYQKMLSLGYHLGPNIDHDNHNTTFGKTTRSRTAVLAPELSKTELIKAIREMRFYATEDCDTKVDFTINTKVMGSIFADRNAPSIAVNLSDATTPTNAAKIRIMFGVPGSGVLPVAIDSVIGSSLNFVDNNLPVNTTGYYYADITNGTARIATSPIWYTRTCGYETDTTAAACNAFEWYGTTYTSSIVTSRRFTTSGGCDSTVTLHLTINHPSAGDTTAVACESFNWYGNDYTASGDYTHMLTNAAGCDSTLTLHLTINAKPTVSISASGTTTFCPTGSVVLTATDAVKYKWTNDADTKSVTVSKTGNYAVTITDANGCSATSETIAVNADDTTPPVAVTKDVTLQLDATGKATLQPAEVNNGSTDNCAIAPDGFKLDKATFDCTNLGTNTVTLTVTDASGNSTSATATITIVDVTKPTFTAPTAQNVLLGTNCSIVVPDLTGGLKGSDNCGAVTFTQLPVAGEVLTSAHNQTHTITITANDGHGNTTTHDVVVTAKDETAPIITAPQNVSVNTDASKCSATNVSLGTPSVSDNCSGTTITNNAPAAFEKGTTTVTWTAIDAAGNTSTATQNVTVTDREKPVVTCPTVPVQCYAASNHYTVPPITATDNCGIATITYTITGATNRNGTGTNASGLFNEGRSTINWTVTDASGNATTCATTVVINPKINVSIPDVYTVKPGGNANTIYIGYGPASVTLNATVSGGPADYFYKWTIGSSAGQALNNTANYTVSPSNTTTYYLNVKDNYGCSAPLVTKTINVVDVRCGSKGDKVTIGTLQKGVYTTNCVSTNSVAAHLANGSYLGSCTSAVVTHKSENIYEKPAKLNANVLPNPSNDKFTIYTISANNGTVTLRILNAVGAVVEVRKNLAANGSIIIGARYRPGIYYAELIQGNEKVIMKLVKKAD